MRGERQWRRAIAAGAIAACVLAASSGAAGAKDLRQFMVQNGSGQPAASVVLTFTKASGKVVIPAPPSVFPDRGSCGAPSADIGGSSTVRVSWGNACVQPFAIVTFDAISTKGPLTFESGAWLGAGGDTLGIVAAGDVQVSQILRANVVSRYLLLALFVSVVLNVGLIWWMGRRRAAKPAT